MTTPTKPQRKSLESTAKQLHSLTQNMALKSAINSLSSNAAAASNLAAFVENATKTAARANNHNLSPVGGGFITPPNSERSNSGDGNVNFTEDEESSMNGSSRSHSESGDGVNDLCRQKFACDLCRKTFTRKYSLSRHYKEVHQVQKRDMFYIVCSLREIKLEIKATILGWESNKHNATWDARKLLAGDSKRSTFR